MAERSLPDLVGRTRLDNSQLKKGAAEAKGQLAGIGKSGQSAGNILQGSFDKSSQALTSRLGPASGIAQKALEGIKASAVGSGGALNTILAGGALAGAAALGALAVKGVSAFVSMTASVRGLQRVTGATAEDASKLAGAMRLLGIDTASGEKAFLLLSKTIANTPDKLAKYGIEVERNSKGNVDLFGTLGNVAEAYQKAGKGAEGNAIALAALGKGGAALLPLLGKTREELDAISKKLGERGLIFDQDALNEGLEFSRSMKQAGEAAKGLEISLGRFLVPILTDAARLAATIVDKFNEMASHDDEPLGLGLGSTLAGIKGIFKAGDDLAKGHFNDFWNDLANTTSAAGASAEDTAASEKELAEATAETAKEADEAARALDRLLGAQVSLVSSTLGLQGAQQSFVRAQIDVKEKTDAVAVAIREHGAKSKEAADAARDLTEAQTALQGSADRVAKQTADVAKTQAEANHETFTATQYTAVYKAALLETAKQIGGPVGAALTTLANQIEDLPEAAATVVTVDTTQATQALLEFYALLDAKPKHTQSLGGVEITTSGPGRMAGGPVMAGMPYIVGERQAELFVPDVSGTIIPSVPRGWDGTSSGGGAPSGMGGGGGTYEITVVVPIDGETVAQKTVRFTARELEKYRVGRA